MMIWNDGKKEEFGGGQEIRVFGQNIYQWCGGNYGK